MATQQDSEIPQASKPQILPDSVLDSEEPALRKKQAVMEWLLGKIKSFFDWVYLLLPVLETTTFIHTTLLSDSYFRSYKQNAVIVDIALST